MFLDAMGKACPMPVIMAKKELDAGCGDLIIAVDNPTAVQNLTRLANDKGLSVETEQNGGEYRVHIVGDPSAAPAEDAPAPAAPKGNGYAVFFGKDHVGEGEGELGYNLAKMAIYTLSQSDELPASMLFMNSGVKLVTGDEPQIIDSLNDMIAQGVQVLVCGTCLNFYGIADQLKVGVVSNMYDILGKMQSADKVITL
ncbi:MAG: sulfurtransferase-like selenium metabolism protein YedF [Oscillospiraceae bacterium]|nr:sulfurtransferase-like selenium metabolism protein YedF [Oscillospiraceae bacterium]